MRRFTRKQVPIAAGISLALFIGLFTIRGWLRGPAISWLSTKLYASQVDAAYERNLTPLNTYLKEIGIDQASPEPGHISRKATCSDGNFSFIRETVYCSRGSTVVDHPITPEFAAGWPAAADRIKTLLMDQGWLTERPEYDTGYVVDDDLRNLLDTGKSSTYASYQKIENSGKLICYLYFRYFSGEQAKLDIDEACYRDVKYFGGYDY